MSECGAAETSAGSDGSVSMQDIGDPVVRKLGGWGFAARERYLFQTAPKQLPTWRLANQSRRNLADVLYQA